MSDDGKPKHLPPGGIRLPEAVRDIALRRVEELLFKGWSRREILADMSERGYTEAMRTVDDWIAEVRKRLAEEDLDNRDQRRNFRRAQLEARYRIQLEDIDEARKLPASGSKYMALAMLQRAAATSEQLLLKLDGLDVLRIDVTKNSNGVPDPRAMSPEARRARLDELLAKRDAALKAQRLNPPTDEHN